MSEPTIRIVLVDDQAIVRAAFQSLLERVPRFKVVGSAADARRGIELVQELRPDVAILDITMPGLSGIDAVAPLKKASPQTKVLMASQHEGQKFVHQALQAGADGYLSKDSQPEELALAIDAVRRGDSYLSPKVAGTIMSRVVRGEPVPAGGDSALAVLTPREREVLALVGEGLSNEEIGAAMFLSPATARTHVSHAMVKLGARDRAQLVVIAYQTGLVSP